MRLEIAQQRAFVGTHGHPVDPEQPTVVFVHGAGMDHTVWTLFGRYFVRHGYNALAADLPGHGRSDGPALERIEAITEWLARLLDAAGVERAMLVGHSMGSLAVLDLAAEWPERVSGLALVGGSAPMPVSDVLLDAAREDDHLAFDMVNIWGHSPMGQMGGIGTPGVWMSGAQLRLLERSAPGVLFRDLSACNDYRRGLECAARVRCPSLMVMGERDAMTPPRAAQKLLAALPDVRSVVLPGCGHALMSEQPNQVLDALIALAARAGEPRAD